MLLLLAPSESLNESEDFCQIYTGVAAHPAAHTSWVVWHTKGHHKPNESHHFNKKVKKQKKCQRGKTIDCNLAQMIDY